MKSQPSYRPVLEVLEKREATAGGISLFPEAFMLSPLPPQALAALWLPTHEEVPPPFQLGVQEAKSKSWFPPEHEWRYLAPSHNTPMCWDPWLDARVIANPYASLLNGKEIGFWIEFGLL